MELSIVNSLKYERYITTSERPYQDNKEYEHDDITRRSD